MSKGKGHKGADPKREERRKAQFAALQQRAAAEPAPQQHKHVEAVDIAGNERKYESLLHAIESGLVAGYDEHDRLLVDDDAERALRLAIARFEGDGGRRSGSSDVDRLADLVTQNIEILFRRQFFSRGEVVGCLRRIVDSVRTHHDPVDPRAYFEFVSDFVNPTEPYPAEPASSGLIWTPGGAPPTTAAEPPSPRRPSGLWLPGDKT